METKWIEKAFEKACKVNDLPKEKRLFLERFPSLFLAFVMTYGPDAAHKVTDSMLESEDLVRFICLAFCCGIVEGKRNDTDVE